MSWATYREALASLREFIPEVRARHSIVKFWCTGTKTWRYCRVFGGGWNGAGAEAVAMRRWAYETFKS